jgi:hypothetical protein
MSIFLEIRLQQRGRADNFLAIWAAQMTSMKGSSNWQLDPNSL